MEHKSAFERQIILEKLWPDVSIQFKFIFFFLIMFLYSEILITVFQEPSYFICRVTYISTFAASVVLPGYLYRKFITLLREDISQAFFKNERACEDWFEKNAEQYFYLKNQTSLIMFILISTSIIFIIFYLGLPFKTLTTNISTLVFFVLVSGLVSYATVLLTFFLYVLYKLSLMNNTIFIYEFKPKVIIKIRSYIGELGSITTLLYVSLQIGTYFSPYGYHIILAIFMSTLAFYPIMLYFSTKYLTERMIENARMVEISKYDQRVIQHKYYDIFESPTKEKITEFNALLDYKEKLLSYNPMGTKKYSQFIIGLGKLFLVISPIMLQLLISMLSKK